MRYGLGRVVWGYGIDYEEKRYDDSFPLEETSGCKEGGSGGGQAIEVDGAGADGLVEDGV